MQNKLNNEKLNSVTGGTAAQIEELKAFIRAHDPDYEIKDNDDISRWLFYKSGLSWDGFGLSNTHNNTYVLSDSNHITHEELMTMLSESFPG